MTLKKNSQLMTREQWQNLYDILNRIHSDFLLAYPTFQNGRNKKIRADAELQVGKAISLADDHISRNLEAYELLTGGESNSNSGRIIIYDEFLLARYFGRDMEYFLNKIEVKIGSFA
jgi:hypothetical protein